jgi:hypothetical protein
MNRFKSFNWHKALGTFALALLTTSSARTEAPTKFAIERPTKEVLAVHSGNTAVALSGDNPKVEPGRVAWHPSFAAACDTSRVSRKPVLLFQMMGKLDEQFC